MRFCRSEQVLSVDDGSSSIKPQALKDYRRGEGFGSEMYKLPLPTSTEGRASVGWVVEGAGTFRSKYKLIARLCM
jgi:hypothetical protein